jgi:hypothetical protein
MTVIVWRNGIMASDSCWTYCDTQVVSMGKIKRLSSKALLGQAGDNDARAIEQLLDRIKDPRKFPSKIELATTKDDFIGILALSRGGVYIVSSSPVDEAGWPRDPDGDDIGIWPATTMGGYAAVGSGADCALAAMDAGANAIKAVEIACRRNIHCRLPVVSVHLHE